MGLVLALSKYECANQSSCALVHGMMQFIAQFVLPHLSTGYGRVNGARHHGLKEQGRWDGHGSGFIRVSTMV